MTEPPDWPVEDPQDDDHEDLSPELLAFAARIADGDPVDEERWLRVSQEEERASTTGPAGSEADAAPSGAAPSLESAQAQVARIALAHRAVQRGASPVEELLKPRPEVIGTWGPLQLLEPLGAGTSAQVYRARDPRLDREVALKLLAVGEGPKAMEEGRLLAQLDHPHIATVFGTDTHPLELFDTTGSSADSDTDQTQDQSAAEPEALPAGPRVGLWMELIRGETLAQRVDRQGPLPPKAAARIGADLASALSTVHEAGLVHCDVKAANALIEEGTDRVVLVDFGIGRALTTAGRPAGTPLYLAPEVLNGQPPGPPADVYGLGVLIHLLLTGRHPVEAESLSELREVHAQGQLQLRDQALSVPTQLVGFLEGCFVVDQERRSSAEELEYGLRRWLNPPQRRWVLPAAVLGVLLTGALCLWGWVWGLQNEMADAKEAYRKGEKSIESAINVYKQNLNSWPYQPMGWEGLADLCSSVGDAECALQASEQARSLIDIFPFRYQRILSDVERIEVLHQYALQRGRFGSSRLKLESLVDRSSDDPILLRKLAMTYLVTGQVDGATRAAMMAYRVDEDSATTPGIAALTLAYTDPNEALDLLDEAEDRLSLLEEPPDDITYFDWPSCVAHFVRGEIEEAQAACARLAGNRNYKSIGTFLQAQVAYGQDGHEAALRAMRNQLEEDRAKNRIGPLLRKHQYLFLDEYLSSGSINLEKLDELESSTLQALKQPNFARRARTVALTFARLQERGRVLSILARLRQLEEEYLGSQNSEEYPDLLIAMTRQVEAELAILDGDLVAARAFMVQAEETGFSDAVTELTYLELARKLGDRRGELATLERLDELCVTLLQEEPMPLFDLIGVPRPCSSI